MVYVWILGGLVVGVAIGIISPFDVPVSYAKYTSVALLAALDSVLAALEQLLKELFNYLFLLRGSFLIPY